MKARKVIVWFRQDLRLHDNEALTEALEVSQDILPVYVLDERLFSKRTPHGFRKTGVHRARFILESVHDLRSSLRQMGTDLIVRFGKPEEEVYELAKRFKTNWVFCNRERTQEEVDTQDDLEHKLWSIGQEIRYSRGKMLYYTADLPFPISQTPDVFTHFRKEVEKFVPVRAPFPTPERLPPYSFDVEAGEIPSLSDLGYVDAPPDKHSVLSFKGGETAGLQRMRHYISETQNIRHYKESRNGLLGEAYSSKFSPWLAQGCLSPKMIYAEIKRHESEHGENSSTYWLFFELMWRDFFRLMGKKHGNAIFKKGGTKRQVPLECSEDMSLFNLWKEARTGIPFIDANMREIAATGFMSNRGRQNVASFLANSLGVNWQIGAEYFESVLLDYDPCSNWGNWNYIAGVGSAPRENRRFNILSQAKKYDANGDYVRYWIPELAKMPQEYIHQPGKASPLMLADAGVRLGVEYPRAISTFEEV